jgi:hypothetical protein
MRLAAERHISVAPKRITKGLRFEDLSSLVGEEGIGVQRFGFE